MTEIVCKSHFKLFLKLKALTLVKGQVFQGSSKSGKLAKSDLFGSQEECLRLCQNMENCAGFLYMIEYEYCEFRVDLLEKTRPIYFVETFFRKFFVGSFFCEKEFSDLNKFRQNSTVLKNSSNYRASKKT